MQNATRYTPNVTRILAVDPGYERLGIAVLEKNKGGKETLLYSECVITSAKLPHAERLEKIGEGIKKCILEWKPETLAIEKLFFSTNQKTVMAVSEARGVILYEAVCAGLTVAEFTPLQVKTATTGYGRSDKNQVMGMVQKLISVSKPIKYDDEWDAIAIGLTFFAGYREKLR